MKSFSKYIMCIGLFAICLTGCNKNEDKIIPSDLKDLEISTGPGTITLHWTVPSDPASIDHIKVEYYDPLLKRDAMKVASVYSDRMVIDNTRKKYGTYTFQINTVSPTGHTGSVREMSIVSEPAPSATHFGKTHEIPLTPDQLYTEMQEPSEGPIANLVQNLDNAGNFFHSRWSGTVPPAPHWFSG